MATLLIDADDTLWENNIYFEEVIATMLARLERRGFARAEIRARLNAIERRRAATSGYGIRNFSFSLADTCRELITDAGVEEEVREVARLCKTLAARPVAVLPGVGETLEALARRHQLVLFTKGDEDDQRSKVDRSGLARYFASTHIVREKDPASYADVIDRCAIEPAEAWMVGNSPRSDILPALEAGLGAVFIPHHATWELEHGEIPSGDGHRLLVLREFRELLDHF